MTHFRTPPDPELKLVGVAVKLLMTGRPAAARLTAATGVPSVPPALEASM